MARELLGIPWCGIIVVCTKITNLIYLCDKDSSWFSTTHSFRPKFFPCNDTFFYWLVLYLLDTRNPLLTVNNLVETRQASFNYNAIREIYQIYVSSARYLSGIQCKSCIFCAFAWIKNENITPLKWWKYAGYSFKPSSMSIFPEILFTLLIQQIRSSDQKYVERQKHHNAFSFFGHPKLQEYCKHINLWINELNVYPIQVNYS